MLPGRLPADLGGVAAARITILTLTVPILFYGLITEPASCDRNPRSGRRTAVALCFLAASMLSRTASLGVLSHALKNNSIDIARRDDGLGIGAGRDDDSGAGLVDANEALRFVCSRRPESDQANSIGIWRQGVRRFYLDYDGVGSWTAGDVISAPFGFSGEIPLLGDWINDGIGQVGIWRRRGRRFT